jgi:hypothetical protein
MGKRRKEERFPWRKEVFTSLLSTWYQATLSKPVDYGGNVNWSKKQKIRTGFTTSETQNRTGRAEILTFVLFSSANPGVSVSGG